MSEVTIIDTTHPIDYDFNYDLTDAVVEFGFEHHVISHEEAPVAVERINASRGVILAGVPFHYPAESAEQLQPNLALWLPQIKVPVLGICLGHQAIGLAFGATMRRDEEVEVGTCTAEIVEDQQADPIFNGMDRRFEIACLHWASLAIEQGPHSRLIRLARSLPKPGVSTGCENQIVRVIGSQIYGAQFHPEKSEVGKKFLRNFLELPRD